VDAIERYFPLAVFTSSQNPPMMASTVNGLRDWYEHASHAAPSTLLPDATLNGFETSLSGVRRRPEPSATAPSVRRVERHQQIAVSAIPLLGDWMSALASRSTMSRYAGHRLWSPFTADGSNAQMVVSDGLPEPARFSMMLEGRW
jgi:hypothetical protein